MSFYYILIGVVSGIWALLCIGGRRRWKDGVFLLACFALLWAVAAFRYGLGIDYNFVYSPHYERLLSGTLGPDHTEKFELGYLAIERLSAGLNSSYQTIYVVTGLLVAAMVVLCYWIQAPNPYVAMFLFFTLSQFYCTLDFIRQSLAALVLTLALPLLKRPKLNTILLYILLVLLAGTFHRSCLLMLAFLPINLLLPVTKRWVLILFGAVTLALYFTVTPIMNFVTQHWYTGYNEESQHVVGTFDPPFAIAMFLCFVGLWLGAELMTRRDKGNYIYVNYAFFAFFFVLMGTRHAILDRFSVDFIFAIPIGYSILFEELADDRGPIAKTRETLLYGVLALGLGVGALGYHHYALIKDHHGVVPYSVVWEQPFYEEYQSWVDTADDEPEILNQLELEAHDPEELGSLPE